LTAAVTFSPSVRSKVGLFDRRSAKALHLTAAQLALLIEGIDWRRTVAPEAPKRPVSYRFRAFLDTLTRTLEMECSLFADHRCLAPAVVRSRSFEAYADYRALPRHRHDTGDALQVKQVCSAFVGEELGQRHNTD
jgi:hypothetical protein